MPYCPSCRAEFRPGFERCEACDQFLVAELEPDWSDPDVLADALKDRAVAVGLLGPLDALRRLRDELARRRVPSMIGPPPEETAPGRSCGTRLALFVAEEDVDAVRRHLLASGADDLDLQVPVDEDGGTGSDDAGGGASTDCPACGTTVRNPAAEECPECGLFLGG